MERYDSYKPSGISWIGEIPSHWNVVTWRSILKEHTETNNPIVTRELLALSYALGVTRYSDKKYNMDRVKEDFSQYKVVHENDFVISPNDIIKGSAYRSRYYGCISPMYLTYHSLSGDMTELDLFGFYVRTRQVGREFFSLAKGLIGSVLENGKYVTRRMSVGRNEINNFRIVLPPKNEQKKIVEFLSTKTSLIDAQQREIERELRLLDELKQAEIANVVTRGLNPDVPMKHAKSLLGDEIPQSWSLIRMRNLVKEQNELVGDRTSFPLLSLTKGGVILRDVESGKGKFPKDFQKYKVVVPDNIIFCLFDIDETPRTVGLSSHNGMITGAYDVFSINEALVNKEFLYYYFLAVDNTKALRPYYTGLRKVVQGTTFLGLQIPIPPIEEQKAIVEYIQQKNTAIDEMIANLRAEIDFLTEYKQRLIADVVTGQIKVD